MSKQKTLQEVLTTDLSGSPPTLETRQKSDLKRTRKRSQVLAMTLTSSLARSRQIRILISQTEVVQRMLVKATLLI